MSALPEVLYGRNSAHRTDDALGSVRLVVDATGAVEGAFDHDVWGVPDTGVTPPGAELRAHTFVGGLGQRNEGGGLYYARQRWYDGNLGRWLSADPIGFEGGLNLYGYTGQNPTTRVDPSGLFDVVGFGAGVLRGLGGLLVGAAVGAVTAAVAPAWLAGGLAAAGVALFLKSFYDDVQMLRTCKTSDGNDLTDQEISQIQGQMLVSVVSAGFAFSPLNMRGFPGTDKEFYAIRGVGNRWSCDFSMRATKVQGDLNSGWSLSVLLKLVFGGSGGTPAGRSAVLGGTFAAPGFGGKPAGLEPSPDTLAETRRGREKIRLKIGPTPKP